MRAIGRALPPNYYPQSVLSAALWNEWRGRGESSALFDRIHRSVGVEGRHLALPMEDYRALDSFSKLNDKWIARATDLAAEAAQAALRQADYTPDAIDHLFITTVTGIASPSVDAKVINRLSMRADIKRTPIFGLGCVGGAAGIARAADYLRAFPAHTAMLIAVELCSLTLQLEDRSVANIIASGLFADGAAAAILTGGARTDSTPAPRILTSRSIFFSDTEEMMGWRLADSGFRIVLSVRVPELIYENLRPAVDSFLAEQNLSRGDIRHWISHPGGPKILQAIEGSLELPREALARSWKSLAAIGNLSSASALFVAGDLLDSKIAKQGEYGMLLAMGPGFCGELVLLQW
ncbi:MAG TPA: 3-oxoacyl-[acyl-carrier-protein] synthase III C-terminal domain-containing protein [Candidatus Binataceae bacterium]|nr:3-oxoacyl-[acyl-carrier-protein] synthase III C-terminal domain-containing protein [Candidatus Binataceae bacterium]